MNRTDLARALTGRTRKPRLDLEGDLQRALVRALDAAGILFFHCPNGGHRSAREGAKLKALGVKPGVPDLIIITRCEWMRRADVPGCVLELKAPKGRVSPEQTHWLAMMQLQGWNTATVGQNAASPAHAFAEGLGVLHSWGYVL
jgi:hypothetical protein